MTFEDVDRVYGVEHQNTARLLLEEAETLRNRPHPIIALREEGSTAYSAAYQDDRYRWELEQQRARDLVAAAQVHALLASRTVVQL